MLVQLIVKYVKMLKRYIFSFQIKEDSGLHANHELIEYTYVQINVNVWLYLKNFPLKKIRKTLTF